MGKIKLTTIAIALAGILIMTTACADQSSSGDLGNAPEPTPTLVVVGSIIDKPVPYGYDIILENIVISLGDIVRPADELVTNGSENNPDPAAGQEYLLLKVTNQCVRMGFDNCYVNFSDYQIIDSAGNGINPINTVSGIDGLYKFQEFSNASSNKGYLVFLVDQNESYQIMTYNTFFGSTVYLSLTY